MPLKIHVEYKLAPTSWGKHVVGTYLDDTKLIFLIFS